VLGLLENKEEVVTDEDYKKVLQLLNEEDTEDLMKRIMLTNTELMESVYDLQEFMEESGLTAEQFQEWKKQKDLRIYH
jgi:pyoverdine/dityrosine biosynthesis protein Dit1